MTIDEMTVDQNDGKSKRQLIKSEKTFSTKVCKTITNFLIRKSEKTFSQFFLASIVSNNLTFDFFPHQ